VPTQELRPRLADGTRLVGGYEGSGFTEPHYLIEREDGQVLHVTRLLFLVAANIDGARTVPEVAALVSAQFGRELTPEGLLYLLEAKLSPLGIIETTSGANAHLPRARPVLALSARGVLARPRTVQLLARLFGPLFRREVVVIALAALVAVDVWLITGHSLSSAGRYLAAHPTLALPLLAILLGSAVFHEFGHAAGCHHSGGRPGAIGVGLYLIYPAFYTDVTDAYRLNRAGRLRTDLGGIYFNSLYILGVAAVYAWTGWAPLLLVVLLVHLEILEQLLPVVRLDGYFILCDLIGVPDLFGRVKPILRSALPGHDTDPRVRELRPKARMVVTVWVLVIVPLITAATVYLIVSLPAIIATTWASSVVFWNGLLVAVPAKHFADAAMAVISLVLLLTPLIGLAILAWRVGEIPVRRMVVRRAGVAPSLPAAEPEAPVDTHLDPSPGAPFPQAPPTGFANNMSVPPSQPPDRTPERTPARHMSAAGFTEEVLLRRPSQQPGRGWRRAVHNVTRGTVTLGPGAAERREMELIARVRAPLRGSRRVAILCRKGGAGKTTTTLMLGHTFATHRGDRVVALDANPDAGSLAHRVQRETAETVTGLLADRAMLDSYADLRAYTSQAVDSRLEVVASDDDPRISQALGESDYHRAVEVLERHFNLVIMDTGTGILESAIQGVLREADQLVVVVPPALDGARVAAGTLDWLEEHNHSDLVRSSVAVINAVRGTELIDIDRVANHFEARCAAVVRIPWDPVLDAGAQARLDQIRPATRRAYLTLAAAVADGFGTPSPRSDARA
jgi:putative peptide zinc metalloprotease protein